jgi:MoxR-like ATPase
LSELGQFDESLCLDGCWFGPIEMKLMMLTYGSEVGSESVRRLVEHQLERADRPVPVCIWGLHGIGKTELVREIAADRGIPLVYLAPAQFEEMGDLLGMPRIEGTSDGRHSVTSMAPPSWVPVQPGPGILLLDDFNRADERILRGIMQLLQYYEMVSWSLPEGWLIVLTANPDGGDYAVTSLDDAMVNRMLHVTMRFDLEAWVRWAERNRIDDRGIHFVLAYPELVNDRRTTPRSLVQFFKALSAFDALDEHLPLVKMLAESALDKEAAAAFVQFVHMKLDRLPGPEDILNARNIDQTLATISRMVQDGVSVRMDILSLLVERLTNHLQVRPEKLDDAARANLKKFIHASFLPNDLRLAMAQKLTRVGRMDLEQLFSDPDISRLILEKM